MAVKIRLKRFGKIRDPHYRIVVADARKKRDGRVIEEIGTYHPAEEPSIIEVNSERAQYWLSVGAQPSAQVAALLKLTGDWATFKGEKNPKSTVKVAEEKVPFVADEKKKAVLKPKAEAPAKEEAPVKEEAKEPKAEEAKADEAKAEKPKADEAKAEKPKTDDAKAEKPKAEEAKADEPKAEKAKAEAPAAEKAQADKKPADSDKA